MKNICGTGFFNAEKNIIYIGMDAWTGNGSGCNLWKLYYEQKGY